MGKPVEVGIGNPELVQVRDRVPQIFRVRPPASLGRGDDVRDHARKALRFEPSRGAGDADGRDDLAARVANRRRNAVYAFVPFATVDGVSVLANLGEFARQ